MVVKKRAAHVINFYEWFRVVTWQLVFHLVIKAKICQGLGSVVEVSAFSNRGSFSVSSVPAGFSWVDFSVALSLGSISVVPFLAVFCRLGVPFSPMLVDFLGESF